MLLLLTILPGLNLLADEKPKVIWSVDLRSSGVDEAIWKVAYGGVTAGIAANTKTVAVALRCPSTPLGKGLDRGPWEVRLLVFDARSGKLLARRGPWTDIGRFTLRSTASGNYLLQLDPAQKWDERTKETLLLLSPDGEELKRLELKYAQEKSTFFPPAVFKSQSGRTLLVDSESNNGRQYQVLETDTLETRMHWTDPAEGTSLFSVAISDEEILTSVDAWTEFGYTPFQNAHKFFLRELGEAKSNSTSFGLATNEKVENAFRPTTFLNNQELVGQVCGDPNCWKLAAVRTDGSVGFQYKIPKSLGFNVRYGAITPTKDGRHFAMELFHESDLSRWWGSSVDMWSFGVKFLVYVWDAKAESPIARLTFGEHLHGYCFVEGETPVLAVLDGPNLKLLSIEAKGAAN